MLIIDEKGSYYYKNAEIRKYHAFINSRYQIIEEIFTDDGKRYVEKNEWDDLNDIEKYFAKENGLDVPSVRARRKAEELENSHEAEIIPFPLNF